MIAAMLRRAGALTLCVYALRTAAAVLIGWPLAVDLGAAVTQRMYRVQPSAGDAALLLELVARRVPAMFVWSSIAALAYVLITPVMSVSWAHALARSSSVRQSLAYGLGRAPQALGIAALALVGSAALLGACAWLLAHGPALLPPSAPAELALRIGCVALAGTGAFTLAAWHDLACAAQLDATATVARTIALAARCVSLRLLLTRAVLALGVAACFVCAEALGRHAASALGATGVLLLQQWLVFSATTLRAASLALALQRVASRSTYGDADA